VRNLRNYDGLDVFRLFAAFLIVGIHTYPLRSVSVELNFFIVHVLSRIGVPFFLMATGYFLLSQYLSGSLLQFGKSANLNINGQAEVGQSPSLSGSSGKQFELRTCGSPVKFGSLLSFVKKTGILYILATVIYLPISIYAGHYADGNVAIIFIRNFVFDGVFYHLWYLPAAIIGALLVYALGRRLSLGGVFGIAIILYIFGLLGDSYYGFTLEVTFLTAIYDVMFNIFSFSRNGLFYAPIFLVMGALIQKQEQPEKVKAVAFACAISLILMCVEGMVLHNFEFTRHDSMYIMLIPCMYFLFRLVRSHKGQQSRFFRDTSMWIYILHPFFIIVVRGIGRILGLTDLLVGNSIIHYLAVCTFSFVAAGVIATLSRFRNNSHWI
jgi:serine/alanine racemase